MILMEFNDFNDFNDFNGQQNAIEMQLLGFNDFNDFNEAQMKCWDSMLLMILMKTNETMLFCGRRLLRFLGDGATALHWGED